MKTGGVVMRRNKDFLAVYRGCNYQSAWKHSWNIRCNSTSDQENSSSTMNYQNTTTIAPVSSDGNNLDEMIRAQDGQWESLHKASLFEREADRLLDGLGPRFVDWWMQKPLPVDADLLPEIVPGFKTPFRRCPPFVSSKLTDAELTYLRKLARPLPTHFVLGRNRKLQGLAAAILKLWEKCHIAKIALKYGSPNTDNEQMAFELGRRGVYDGVIEGMHQHWKHREIVKVLTMQKTFSRVVRTAKCLETESGGILVSIIKLKEGHAIIVYRGKNYKRPKSAAKNLLNKREALSRSFESQRLGSLKFFASQREQAIRDLKCKLAELSEKKN